MATVLDVGILDHFVPIFIFILIFVLIYAVLLKTNLFGENRGLVALISFATAFLFIVTRAASEFVELVTPWFVVLIIVAMCFLLIFMFLGIKPEAIASAVGSEGIVWTIVIILLVLLGIALTKVIGPGIAAMTQEEGVEEGFMTTIGSIIFHPKILGVFFILVIASFAIRAVSKAT